MKLQAAIKTKISPFILFPRGWSRVPRLRWKRTHETLMHFWVSLAQSTVFLLCAALTQGLTEKHLLLVLKMWPEF